MQERKHIIASFDESLNHLQTELHSMGRVTRQMIDHSISGLLERNENLCNEVIAEDETLDQYELSVDEIGLQTLLKFRPVAQDLRLVLSTMSISRNLERIGDHSVNIAKRSRKIIRNFDEQEVHLIEPLATKISSVLSSALQSFVDGDVELATSIKEDSSSYKKMAKSLQKTFSSKLEETSDLSLFYLHMIFIVRSLQRMGGLSVNIAEDAIFHESAEDIRHQ